MHGEKAILDHSTRTRTWSETAPKPGARAELTEIHQRLARRSEHADALHCAYVPMNDVGAYNTQALDVGLRRALWSPTEQDRAC